MSIVYKTSALYIELYFQIPANQRIVNVSLTARNECVDRSTSVAVTFHIRTDK